MNDILSYISFLISISNLIFLQIKTSLFLSKLLFYKIEAAGKRFFSRLRKKAGLSYFRLTEKISIKNGPDLFYNQNIQ